MSARPHDLAVVQVAVAGHGEHPGQHAVRKLSPLPGRRRKPRRDILAVDVGDPARVGPDRGHGLDAAQGRVAGVQRQADHSPVARRKASRSSGRSTTVPRWW
jgi:hypothetical protein